jgi:hypothetical protein
MKKYILTQNVLGENLQIDISEADFANVGLAYATLQNIISSEEQFDAVARNFFDLESDLLAMTLEFTYVGLGDGMKRMAARRLLNRRLLNLLSAARGYMDHQRHTVKEVFGKADPRSEEAAEMFRVAHSENFGYRLMEELRNACQHRIFPIHVVVFNVQNEREKDALHSSVEMCVDINELKTDKKFKRQVLDELMTYGEIVDLRAFVRTYVEGIAKAHRYFRDNVDEISSRAGEVLKQNVDKYLNEGKRSSTLGLYAVQVEESAWVESVPLSTGLLEYGEYLAKQNMHFETASITYVSSSVIKKS